jgi:hypothetical protein
MGERRYSSTLVNLGTRSWVVGFTHRQLYRQGNSPRCSLYRWLGGPQSRSGRCGQVKNSLPRPGIELQFFYRPSKGLGFDSIQRQNTATKRGRDRQAVGGTFQCTFRSTYSFSAATANPRVPDKVTQIPEVREANAGGLWELPLFLFVRELWAIKLSEQNHSWGVNIISADLKMSCLSWNLNVRYRVQNSS